MRSNRGLIVVALAAAAVPAACGAQAFAARVDGAPTGSVEFSFAARPGVCGNGRTYIQTAPGSFTGSTSTDMLRTEPCEPGPVRVVVDRAGREIIAIQTYVGPKSGTTAESDLGRISGQQAADYLLSLATRAEGRVGRDALMPATLADSASIADGLVTVARNKALPRETRTSALSYVGRPGDRVATVPASVVTTLTAVARDEGDNLTVRKQALSVLGRLEHGAGIVPLIELAAPASGALLSREATSILATSGDPRARAYLRSAVQRGDLPEESMALAIRALGQQYSTQADAALLRGAYPRLSSERSRDAILTAMGDVGGAENVKWLLDLAKNETETPARRRKAIDNASRAGAPIGDLVAVYDGVTDPATKEALVSIYQRSGERAAVDKLISISQRETNVNVRRKAVTALGTSDDPRARDALGGLVR